MRQSYMIIVGLNHPIYSQILKCEKSGQNLIFNNIDEANEKIKSLEASSDTKARAVAI